MGLLPWSFGFLLVFSLLLWSQLKTMKEALFEHQLVIHAVEIVGNDISENIHTCQATGSTERKRVVNHDRHQSSGKKNLSTRLNARALFTGEGSNKDDVKKIFFRLVSILYGSQPIFEKGDNTAQVVELFEKVLEKQEEMRNKGHSFSKLSDLSRIDLRDSPDELNIDQIAFYHMLVGGSGTIRGDEVCRIHGLKYYIDLKRKGDGPVCSVYLAPKNLLLALFGRDKEDVVNELLEYRKDLVKQIRASDGADFSLIEGEFKQKYEGSLPSDINKDLVDFSVSTSRPFDSPYDSYANQKKLKRSLRRYTHS